MATAIEYGLIAALIAVAVVGGVSSVASKKSDQMVSEMEETEKPPIRQLITIGPEQEGILGFDDAKSPIIIRNTDGSFRFTCPIGTRPVADDETPLIHDGYCAAYNPPLPVEAENPT